MNVVIVGAGYVGLATGAALAYLGHDVACAEKDPAKLKLLSSGRSAIHEFGLEELMRLAGKNLRFFECARRGIVEEAEVIIIAVGTPPRSSGKADTQYVEAAAREVAEGLCPGRAYTLVIKSTVPVGSNRLVNQVVQRALAARGLAEAVSVRVVSNPEFLQEGRALFHTFYPDRIVVGTEEGEGVEVLRRLYRQILEQNFVPPPFLPRPMGYAQPTLLVTSPASAEMIKYAADTFLAQKISFVNEIAGLCEKVGADVTEVARGIGLDPRIGPGFLAAGLGWGGSCFPKDTAALQAMGEEHNYPMPLVAAAREVNYRQRQRLVERLQEALKGIRGRTIGVLGLAFKPGTADVRESPALDVVRLLVERQANVRAHDPVAIEGARSALIGLEVEFFRDPYELAADAEALILATDWPEYRLLDLARLGGLMRTPVLVDERNLFDPKAAARAGFTYFGVGR